MPVRQHATLIDSSHVNQDDGAVKQRCSQVLTYTIPLSETNILREELLQVRYSNVLLQLCLSDADSTRSLSSNTAWAPTGRTSGGIEVVHRRPALAWPLRRCLRGHEQQAAICQRHWPILRPKAPMQFGGVYDHAHAL